MDVLAIGEILVLAHLVKDLNKVGKYSNIYDNDQKFRDIVVLLSPLGQ